MKAFRGQGPSLLDGSEVEKQQVWLTCGEAGVRVSERFILFL